MPLPLILRARRRSVGHAPLMTSRRPALPSVLACPGCFSDAVAYVEQHEHGGSHRLLLVRCGECGAWRRALMTVAAAVLLERHLDAGRAAIAAQLQRQSASTAGTPPRRVRPGRGGRVTVRAGERRG
jgi:hypothetical protein